jgi:uncharacterized membrane protein
MSETSGKTSTGLQQNVAGLLCYLAGWVTGIIFVVIEKENQFVRFHAIQSIVVFGALTVADVVLSIVFGFIPVIGSILMWLLWVLTVIVWIVLMLKAYQGERYKFPWAGDFAEKQLNPKPKA